MRVAAACCPRMRVRVFVSARVQGGPAVVAQRSAARPRAALECHTPPRLPARLPACLPAWLQEHARVDFASARNAGPYAYLPVEVGGLPLGGLPLPGMRVWARACDAPSFVMSWQPPSTATKRYPGTHAWALRLAKWQAPRAAPSAVLRCCAAAAAGAAGQAGGADGDGGGGAEPEPVPGDVQVRYQPCMCTACIHCSTVSMHCTASMCNSTQRAGLGGTL